MTRTLLTCLTFMLASCAQWSLAAPGEPPPIRVGYIEFPPYSYTDEHGQPAGDLLQFFRQVARQAGYETHFVEYPSYRLFKAMEAGLVEMSPSLVNHPVMGPYTVRSRYRIAQVLLNLYYKDRAPPAELKNLRDSRLLLVKGLVYLGSQLPALATEPASGVSLVRAPTHRSAVRMMHLGRADFLLDYQDPAQEAFHTTGLPVLPHVTLLRQDFTIAYSLQSPRASQLRDELDQAIETLQARGELEKKYADIQPYTQEDAAAP